LRTARQIGGDTAGTNCDSKNDNSCGVHTLYSYITEWALPALKQASLVRYRSKQG
jgi:hypothetical protein